MTYNRVCGRITAYQIGTPDAFYQSITNDGVLSPDIDRPYIDGISITHGSTGSRQHIWTFVTAFGEGPIRHVTHTCGCNDPGIVWPYTTAGTFIGDDYFCESGVKDASAQHGVFYPSHAIWDGTGCNFGTCCEFSNPPWFCKALPQPTTDDLEVRICHDESLEGSPIELMELYVQ
jgi:hypothetical protein